MPTAGLPGLIRSDGKYSQHRTVPPNQLYQWSFHWNHISQCRMPATRLWNKHSVDQWLLFRFNLMVAFSLTLHNTARNRCPGLRRRTLALFFRGSLLKMWAQCWLDVGMYPLSRWYNSRILQSSVFLSLRIGSSRSEQKWYYIACGVHINGVKKIMVVIG